MPKVAGSSFVRRSLKYVPSGFSFSAGMHALTLLVDIPV
jgi:hypothetical protein